MGAKKMDTNLKIVETKSQRDVVDTALGFGEIEQQEEVKENPVLVKMKMHFDRLTQLIIKSEMDAILLLKEWINELSDESILALKAVSQQLDEDLLYKVFLKLNGAEREAWKSNVDGFLKGEDLVRANKFISEEVVRNSIAPQGVADIELIDLLLSLDLEVAVNFVKTNVSDAPVLLNLLRPKIAGKILDKLDMEESKKLITKSLVFDFATVKDEFKDFKNKLKEFVVKSKKKPFNTKILQMLPNFNPNKEKMLYKVLAQENLQTDMKKAAADNFPSELVTKLPTAFLTSILQKYDQIIKVQLLASLDDETKQFFLSTFAEEGSAAREMIDLEFENLENDAIAQSRIKGQKDQLWKDFVTFVRAEIKEDQKWESDIQMIVSEWVTNLCEENAA